MPGPGSIACPKPERRSTTKARKGRREGQVKQSIRAIVSERDGYCRLIGIGGAMDCKGVSEWAHLGEKRRARTRGMEPEDRHTSAHSVMFCQHHHLAYDARQMYVELLTARGADGPLQFSWRGFAHCYTERRPLQEREAE